MKMSILIGKVCGALLVVLSSALAIMLLWNILMPTIFSLPALSFWQALGMYILSNILFKQAEIKVWSDK